MALQPDCSTEVLLAIAQYQNGDIKEATERLQAVLTANPASKDGHFALAGFYAHEKRYREAASEYTAVLQLDPSDTQALIEKTNALISAEAYSDAIQPAQLYVQRRPEEWRAHLLLGGVESELGQNRAAEEDLAFVIARQPQNPVAFYEMGRALLAEGQLDQAVSNLEKAHLLDPSNTGATFTLARALRKVGQSERANELFEAIQRKQTEDLQKGQQFSRIAQANDLLKRSQAAQAAELYQQILDTEPKNARVTYDLALARKALNDVPGERQALQSAIELDPKLAIAKLEMGRLEESNREFESARQWYQSAIESDPQMATAKDALGVLDARLGHLGDSTMLLREAIEDDPVYLQTYLDLAETLREQDQAAAAMQALEDGCRVAPNDPRFLVFVAKAMHHLGRDEEALSLSERVIKVDPQLLDAYLEVVFDLASLGQLAPALQAANRTVQLFPQSAEALTSRGRLEFYSGQPAQAEETFSAASRLDPQNAEPYYLAALVQKQKGQFLAAAGRFADAARLQPEDAMIWYELGVALESASRPQPAIQAWKQAVNVDRNNLLSLESLHRVFTKSDQTEAEQVDRTIKALKVTNHMEVEAQSQAADAAALMKADDWPSAMIVLQKALVSCGQCAARPKLLAQLGIIHFQTGDLKGGEEYLSAALQLDPKDPSLKEQLLKVHRALDLSQQASGHTGPAF